MLLASSPTALATSTANTGHPLPPPNETSVEAVATTIFLLILKSEADITLHSRQVMALLLQVRLLFPS